MSDQKVFGAGIPTNVDVKKLIAAVGIPVEGDEIAYDLISDTIGLPRTSYRWRTVTAAWRKLLYREYNLVTETVPGKAVKVLPQGDRVHHASSRFKNGMRTIYRAGDVAAKTDISRLLPDEQRACTHIVNSTASLRMAAALEAKRFKLKDPHED